MRVREGVCAAGGSGAVGVLLITTIGLSDAMLTASDGVEVAEVRWINLRAAYLAHQMSHVETRTPESSVCDTCQTYL